MLWSFVISLRVILMTHFKAYMGKKVMSLMPFCTWLKTNNSKPLWVDQEEKKTFLSSVISTLFCALIFSCCCCCLRADHIELCPDRYTVAAKLRLSRHSSASWAVSRAEMSWEFSDLRGILIFLIPLHRLSVRRMST